jgi:hypothetical protein
MFCPFRYRKTPGYQTDLTKIEPPHGILLKQQEQIILKAIREKKQVTYKGKPIKITTISQRNLKSKKVME